MKKSLIDLHDRHLSFFGYTLRIWFPIKRPLLISEHGHRSIDLDKYIIGHDPFDVVL